MKASITRRSKNSGFALLLVLFTLVAMIMILGSTMFWLTTNVDLSAKNNYFTSAQAAAEAATEMAFAQMDKAFLLNSLLPASAYYSSLPDQSSWPVKFTYSDTNGNTGRISIDEGSQSGGLEPLGMQYANLQGYAQIVTIIATATPVNQLFTNSSKAVSATVKQQINFATVPAFQFAIFYNINLEIDPGATMPIAGAVFSNGGIWSGNGNPTYSSTVEAAGNVTITATDPFLTTYTDSGTPTGNFTLSSPTQPVSHQSPLEIPIGASTNNSDTNVIAIIQLPPASVAAPLQVAYATTNQCYTYNEATLVVSNWLNGTRASTTANTPVGNNLSVYLQDSWSGPSWYGPSSGHMNAVTNDFYVVTNNLGTTIHTNTLVGLTGFGLTNFPSSWAPTANMNIKWTSGTGTNILHWGVQYAGWSFLTNVSFYDYRESATVQAVQVDVGMLRSWITNNSLTGGSNWNRALCLDTGAGINSIYVYNAVPLNSTQLPAVRVMDGLRLPNSTNVISGTNCVTSGLSVVTPQPMYVLGNYNAQIDGDGTSTLYLPGTNNMAHTYPAAFMADAITILSGNWSGKDGTYISTTALSSRNPAATVINAACLEGIVQSSTNYTHVGGANGYSGGVENFLRLLENWSSSTALTYNGSIMVMFSSQYATNWWQQTGNYYNAPKRVWSFDTNFTQAGKLPPLTPQFTTVIRSNYVAY
ncbi:MAG TPA: hypothetical protein VGI03_13200 [Verrucomicrobiae bacterium]|jgi:hypothetical protein